MFETALGVIILVVGIVLMMFSSEKAVEHSIIFASALGVSPLMIGLVLVSLGTDLPEIVNSLVSSALGHGNINVGDSIGSVLTQLTLVLGLLPFIIGSFRVKRKEIIVLGLCEILSLMLAISIVEKGYISRINALFLVGSWPLYILLTEVMIGGDRKKNNLVRETRGKIYHITLAILGFIGVAVGAYAVVQSVIMLSTAFGISEYFISFFLAAIGTSLPELVVDITALRKGESEIAIGDLIGSCIIDASFSMGIGQVFFPQKISGELASITILYTIFASSMVIITLALREKVDKRAGTAFITLYLLSYLLLTI